MSKLLLLLLVVSFPDGWCPHTSLCPGWNNLSCDCEYDCGGAWCECAEAQADTCCGGDFSGGDFGSGDFSSGDFSNGFTSTGPCKVSGLCVCTSNYDHACDRRWGNYGNYETCDINALTVGSLQVTAFSTEYGYDKLTVNGVEYQGYGGPSGIVPTGAMRWRSDGYDTTSGWRMCLSPTPPPTPPALPSESV